MMRQVVGTLTGVLIVEYLMYWIIPLISSEHTMFSASPLLVNTTDATVVTSYNLGNGFYNILPLIPILVAAFVLINYALKRDAGE